MIEVREIPDDEIARLWVGTSPINMKDNFERVILYYSESNNFNEAMSEWSGSDLHVDSNSRCICSHDINYVNYVVNSKTNFMLRIGSDCIDKFSEHDELKQELAEYQKRIKYKGDKYWCTGCKRHMSNDIYAPVCNTCSKYGVKSSTDYILEKYPRLQEKVPVKLRAKIKEERELRENFLENKRKTEKEQTRKLLELFNNYGTDEDKDINGEIDVISIPGSDLFKDVNNGFILKQDTNGALTVMSIEENGIYRELNQNERATAYNLGLILPPFPEGKSLTLSAILLEDGNYKIKDYGFIVRQELDGRSQVISIEVDGITRALTSNEKNTATSLGLSTDYLPLSEQEQVAINVKKELELHREREKFYRDLKPLDEYIENIFKVKNISTRDIKRREALKVTIAKLERQGWTINSHGVIVRVAK